MKVLVVNGPNLQKLGSREPEIYGAFTLSDIEQRLSLIARENNINIDFFQSDSEGKIVSRIGEEDFDYLIINPAAYTHTSVAIRDSIAAARKKAIEVHISNVYAREDFRKKSLTAPVCVGQIAGFGILSYVLALEYIIKNENRQA